VIADCGVARADCRIRKGIEASSINPQLNAGGLKMTNDLARLRELLHSTVVEVEVAIDTQTYPDWSETKENLLRAVEIVRRLERDSVWAKLAKKK
jgi:hypothetical protein